MGSFVQARYLCVLIHIWVGGGVGAVGPVCALRWGILLTVPGRCFFCGSFMFLFCLVFAVSLCTSVCVCFVVDFWGVGGGGWPLGSRFWCLLWVCHLSVGVLIFAPLLTLNWFHGAMSLVIDKSKSKKGGFNIKERISSDKACHFPKWDVRFILLK